MVVPALLVRSLERRRGLSPCSPSHCGVLCGVWVTPGCSIPVVYLPTDVATAVRVSCRDKLGVTTRLPVTTGYLSWLPFLSRWYRDGLGGRDNTRLASGVSVASLACRRVPQGRVALRTFCYKPAVPISVVVAPPVLFCPPSVADFKADGKTVVGSGVESLVELPWLVCNFEVVEVFFQCRPVSPSHCLALHWFRSCVGRVGVGPQLGRAAVVGCVVLGYGLLASLYLGRHPTIGSVTRFLGAVQWHRKVWFPDLVACPRSRVVLLVRVEGCFRIVLTLLVLRESFPTALAGRDSLSQEFVAERSWWRLVRRALPAVASFPVGSECELQESVVAVAGCACYERGCWFTRAAVGFVVVLHIRVGVSRRLKEPTCVVAFTGAGLLLVDSVEVGILARAKQMLVCRVAPLVEHCDTCLWLLSALCWLVVNSGEVLPEFFSIGSGGNRLAVVLVRLALRTVPGLSLPVVVLPPVLLAVEWFVFVLGYRCVAPVWDFMCPCGRVVCFAPRTLRALLDGCLASDVGVRLAVPLVAVLALCAVSSFARGRGLLHAFFLCFLGCSGWWCSAMAFGAMLHTVATFVAKVPFLELCAWRHLSPFDVWPSLPMVVGAVPGVCVLLRADAVVALLKLLVSCGESFLSYVVSAVGATVLHLAEFWCLWWHHVLVLEWFVLCHLEPGCIVLYLGWLLVLVLAPCVMPYVLIVSLFVVSRVCSVFEAYPYRWYATSWPRPVSGFSLSLGSECVQLGYPSYFWSASLCGRRVVLDLCGCFVACAVCRRLGMPGFANLRRLLWHSVCGGVMVVTTKKSWYDLVVPLHLLFSLIGVTMELPIATVIRVVTTWCVSFLSRPINGLRQGSAFRSFYACQKGRAVALRLVTRQPALSHLGGRRIKALAGAPSPSFGIFLLSLLLSEEGILFPLSSSGCGAWWCRRWLVRSLERRRGARRRVLVTVALPIAMGEQCGPDMPAHLHCWFTVWNCSRGRRRDLNASALLDAIPGIASVTRGTDRVEDALSGTGEGAVVPSMEVFRRFQLPAVRAVLEPREDDAQSVGVPSTRRFWHSSASSS
ncbi:hypothetical protein Taro_033238 [Colocasia esculenta]|uniref:Uncharacterized protein n=1 Tax=Colocasia esculenta TaxID=4460 RepID=A0A843W6D7_COLES|nr:hypothetical protein [Colocasia esculenta]